MAAERVLRDTKINGMKIANRSRLIIGIITILIVISASANTEFSVFISLLSGLLIFLVLSIINIITLNKRIYSSVLLFITVIYEVSLPTLFKLSIGFSGNHQQAVNDSIFFSVYFLMIILSLMQNRRLVTYVSGIIAAVEYSIVIIISIFIWKVPVISGAEVAGKLVIDNEIAKVVIILGFTYIATILLKNLRAYSAEAHASSDMAEEKAENLQTVINTANEMTENLIDVSENQKSICGNLSGLSQDQASMSEEFSSVHEEQYASIESINKSTSLQQEESLQSIEYIKRLRESQVNLIDIGKSVLQENERISVSSRETQEKLNEMMQTMEVISTGGRSITEFITVINDITDQINLLSLNAAIEAARAGDREEDLLLLQTK